MVKAQSATKRALAVPPKHGRIKWPCIERPQGPMQAVLHRASLSEQGRSAGDAGSSTPAEGTEMDSSFDTPDQEAHASPKLRIVLRDDRRGLRNEHLDAVTRWVAAQKMHQIHGVEERLMELRLIGDETRSDDLRATIDAAIEDSELRLAELLSQNASPSAT
jgi:hypothetical protein